MLLPGVSPNLMAGLLETVAAEPYKGHADLPALAGPLHMEIDDLFPVAETLQLLRFAELAEGDSGSPRPAGASSIWIPTVAKRLFAQHLLAYVPLAGHIRRVLDERGAHRAPASRFRDELEDHMSEQFADQTLRSVTSWGRYAESLRL